MTRLLPNAAAFVALLLTIVASQLQAAEFPGVPAEFETGLWHTQAKDHDGASGGKRVSWFDQPGRAVQLRFELAEAMPRAVLFVRYSRNRSPDSTLELAFGPAARAKNLPILGVLRLAQTGGWERYRWLATPIGDLDAGVHLLNAKCIEGGGAGDLDVALLAADDAGSRWMPPDEVRAGVLTGPGRQLDAPRPNDLLDAETLADLQARNEALAQERAATAATAAAAAAARAHISDPAQRLPITATWFGNDIEVGEQIPPGSGHTPHNVADIHVTSEQRNRQHHWKRAGKVVRCYENWDPTQPVEDWQLHWELAPPSEDVGGGNDGDGNLMSIDIAGDYLFLAREGQSGRLGVKRGHVEVYRLDDGTFVGWMGPPDNLGHVGIIDITHGMKAFRRANGEYLIFLEDSGRSRTIVYRWRPAD